MCLTTSFVFFFFSLPSISSSLSNKHFALFVSVDCHGDNGTRVTAQPAPWSPGPVDQCRRNQTRPGPFSPPQAADHDAHLPRMQKWCFSPLPRRRLSALPSVPNLQVERHDGKKMEEKEICCLGFHLTTASSVHEVALSANTKPSLPHSLLQLNGCIVNL